MDSDQIQSPAFLNPPAQIHRSSTLVSGVDTNIKPMQAINEIYQIYTYSLLKASSYLSFSTPVNITFQDSEF